MRQKAQRQKTRVKRRKPLRFDDSLGCEASKDQPCPAEVNPEAECPGSIYRVPDKYWNFTAVGREDHPGVCTSCDLEGQMAILLKGSDALGRRAATPAYVIEPSRANGLQKATAFDLSPRSFRLRRVVLLHTNRRIGRLDADDLRSLRHALERRFPLVK